MRYDHMKIAVGGFVFAVVVAIAVSGYYFLHKKGAFSTPYIYHSTTTSAASLNIGMPIQFSGFTIGNISDIKLTDTGDVALEISIDETHKKWITKGSELILQKPLLGSTHIELVRAKNSVVLQEGTNLPLAVSDDINDLVTRFEPVVEKMVTIVTNIEKLSNDFAAKDSDFALTLSNLRKLSAKLSGKDPLLRAFVGKGGTQTILRSLQKTENILSNIETTSQTIDTKLLSQLSTSLEKVDTILLDIDGKLKRLDPAIDGAATLSKDVPVLQKEVGAALTKSNQLLNKIDTILNDNKQTLEMP